MFSYLTTLEILQPQRKQKKAKRRLFAQKRGANKYISSKI
jgi:hypothetical protein